MKSLILATFGYQSISVSDPIFIAFSLGAYLTGSVSGAILVCQLFGLADPREHGSHNPGATNVYRLGGAFPALTTLFVDALKGALPVALATALSATPMQQGAIALFAMTGHILPVFFAFRGGKGVATAMGAGLALAWPTTLVITSLWLTLAWLYRYSSIASLGAALTAPLFSLYFSPDYTESYLLISVIILIRHRTNLLRLIGGQELSLNRRS